MKALPTKLWITKYALTKGVEETEGEWSDAYNAFVVERPMSVWQSETLSVKHAHTSRPTALARANQMRDLKIASLEKQIKKLREMKFE